jgi:hypothetical protein
MFHLRPFCAGEHDDPSIVSIPPGGRGQGSKTLSELTAMTCAAFVEHRGHADGARPDPRAVINRHVKKTIVSAFELRVGRQNA